MAQAYLWVSRIFSICGTMVLPGLLGYWIDRQLEIQVFSIAGFLLGLLLGMIQLVMLAKIPVKNPTGNFRNIDQDEDVKPHAVDDRPDT